MGNKNEYIGTTEAAKLLQMTSRRVVGLCGEGKLPGAFQAGRNWKIPVESVKQYMSDAGYHFTILYDETYEVTRTYGISGYPTTFAMKKDGSFLGYMPGYMSDDVLEQVVAELTSEEQ